MFSIKLTRTNYFNKINDTDWKCTICGTICLQRYARAHKPFFVNKLDSKFHRVFGRGWKRFNCRKDDGRIIGYG